MAAKLALFFVFFLVAVYVNQAAEISSKAESGVKEINEAAPQAEKNAQETIKDTMDKISSGFEELVSNIKNSEFVQESSKAFEKIGKDIQEAGQATLDKLKAKTPSS